MIMTRRQAQALLSETYKSMQDPPKGSREALDMALNALDSMDLLCGLDEYCRANLPGYEEAVSRYCLQASRNWIDGLSEGPRERGSR